MKLIIFHPETNELIGQEEFYYVAIGEYLCSKRYPDRCYFHKESTIKDDFYSEKIWGRFYITKGHQTKLSAGSWVDISPDLVPASAKATVLLLS